MNVWLSTALVAGTLGGGWFASDYYGFSLDPRDHIPVETECYLEGGAFHIEELNSFNLQRTPKVTKFIRISAERHEFAASDSINPNGIILSAIEEIVFEGEALTIYVEPGHTNEMEYRFRSLGPDCEEGLRTYLATVPEMLSRIY